MEKVEVPVLSAWMDKINWTQFVSVAAGFLTIFGFSLPPETQAQIVTVILALNGVITWIGNTWFNKTVTPSVAAKLLG